MKPLAIKILCTVLCVTLLLAGTGVQTAHAFAIIYVKANASGANNGTSWTNAYTSLQNALAAASSGDQIWVAAGAYYPDEGTGQTNDSRTSTFTLKNGVSVYGGFNGTENSLSSRNVAANVSILSGDIDKNDTNTDGNNIAETTDDIQGNNAYHVVTGVTGGALDGFVITAGKADDYSIAYANDSGAGIYVNNADVTLVGLTIIGNFARTGGGIFFNASCCSLLANSTITSNYVSNGGAGVMIYNNSESTLVNVTIDNNLAFWGGGIAILTSQPTLTNVTISNNSSTLGGGGLHTSAGSSTTLTNVTFSNNSSPDQNAGDGVFNQGNLILKNTLIANGLHGRDCANSVSGTIDISSSNNLIESTGVNACGLTNGVNGNIVGFDPKLGPLENNGGFTKTRVLLSGSLAINAGANTACLIADQRGIPRPQNGTCDIGAVEAGFFHVKAGASGSGSGVDWANAYPTLQNALAASANGDQVWVAKGVYYPDEGTGQTNNSRGSAFVLKNGVTLLGGFNGTENNLGERNIGANPTILSGDIDKNDINTDGNNIAETTSSIQGSNAYHVVVGTTGGTLDGFIVTAGQANGAFPNDSGGGVYNNGAKPSLYNLTISGNLADSGGGMLNLNSADAILTGVTFRGNLAGYGGAMYNYGSVPALTNVTFSGNSAGAFGGAILNTLSNPVLRNVTFSGNAAPFGGGMYSSNSSTITLWNTIIADSTSGGDCVNASGSTIAAGSGNNLIESTGTNACGLTNGIINGNIIGADPVLGPLANNGGPNLTLALLPGSPALEAGTNLNCFNLDQRLIARPQGAHCDIGAYERTVAPTFTDVPFNYLSLE